MKNAAMTNRKFFDGMKMKWQLAMVLAIEAILNQPQIAPFDKPVLGTAKFRPVIPRPDHNYNYRQLTGI